MINYCKVKKNYLHVEETRGAPILCTAIIRSNMGRSLFCVIAVPSMAARRFLHKRRIYRSIDALFRKMDL